MNRAGSFPADRSPQSTPLGRERAIADIAAAQHGVISLTQLLSLGLSARAVRDRVAAGKLHRLYRGVYAVGHTVVSWKGRYMAAVLACQPDAYISHGAAARLHGLRPASRRLELTVIERRVRVPGLVVRRTAALADEDVTEIEGIACTSVARTLLDEAGSTDDRGVERMIDRAEQLRIFDLNATRRALARAPRRSGARRLGRLLGAPLEPTLTRSELEERFFAICAGVGLPRPVVNMPIALGNGEYVEVDFAWPDRRLIVETDGWETHGTRRAFVNDRRRDRLLALAGWRPLRFTWQEIEHEPDVVAAELGALLALAS